eukprot:10062355-Alexandrium_andersonii.AAC.1
MQCSTKAASRSARCEGHLSRNAFHNRHSRHDWLSPAQGRANSASIAARMSGVRIRAGKPVILSLIHI